MITPTILEYLNNSYQTSSAANVVKTEQTDGLTTVILDNTIFYPQGGGQPFDTGTIQTADSLFHVKETRFRDGLVLHFGIFEKGSFSEGQKVNLTVDAERRLLYSRLHSAGHLLDLAMINTGHKLLPTKGYHFPDGPYVEYAGEIAAELRSELCNKLNDELEKLISLGGEVKDFTVNSKKDLSLYCVNIPEYIPEGKPVRVVKIAEYYCPCGGTHVKNIAELKTIIVLKVKSKGCFVRISYKVD